MCRKGSVNGRRTWPGCEAAFRVDIVSSPGGMWRTRAARTCPTYSRTRAAFRAGGRRCTASARSSNAAGNTVWGAASPSRRRAFLPYLIRWEFTVVEQHYPNGSRIVATGDLEGDGRWTLRQDGADTAVTYEWSVNANHAFIRRFSWLLRPLFAANHNWTMAQGLRGLRAELAARATPR